MVAPIWFWPFIGILIVVAVGLFVSAYGDKKRWQRRQKP